MHSGQVIAVATDGVPPVDGSMGPDDLWMAIDSVTDPSENLTLSNGTAFPALVRVSVMKPHLPVLDMKIEVRKGVPRLTFLGMQEWSNPDAEENPGISASQIRYFPIGTVFKRVVEAIGAQAAAETGVPAETGRRASRARERRVMDRDHLLRVAGVVKAAPQGTQPRVAIQREIPCSDRTAYRWLNAAREEGLI